MSASTPQELPWLLLDALNDRDVDRVVSLYEPAGVVADGFRQVAVGHDAIRRVTSALLARAPRFEMRQADVLTTDDLCIIRARWSASFAAVRGTADAATVDSVLAVRRQEDGRWLVALDRSDRRNGAVH